MSTTNERYRTDPEFRAAHIEKTWAHKLKRVFGITAEDYYTRLDAQGGRCAICRSECPTGRKLAVDHDHETGLVRGLLCFECNVGLGKFRDDPERLQAALDYLKE